MNRTVGEHLGYEGIKSAAENASSPEALTKTLTDEVFRVSNIGVITISNLQGKRLNVGNITKALDTASEERTPERQWVKKLSDESYRLTGDPGKWQDHLQDSTRAAAEILKDVSLPKEKYEQNAKFDGNNIATAAFTDRASIANANTGGIDLNSANLNFQIKRDGKGVPLPLALQDMAQLGRIDGFQPNIIDITPVKTLPILSELQQKLRSP